MQSTYPTTADSFDVDHAGDTGPIQPTLDIALDALNKIEADLIAARGADASIDSALDAIRTGLTNAALAADGGTVESDLEDATVTAHGALTTGAHNLAALLGAKADASTVTAHTADLANPHAVTKAQVGLPNVDNTTDAAKPVSTAQLAALNAKADLVGGVIPTAQLPALATGQTTTAANQAAMLAQTAAQVQPGDVTIRSDLAGRRFLLAAADPSVLGNWIALEVPDAVSSVNGQQGAVVLAAGDVGAQPADADLSSIAGLATAAFGRSLLTGTDAAGVKALLTLVKGDVGLSNVDNTADTAKALAGDATGSLGAVTVARVRGKNVPAPGASEDQKTWVYDHASGAMVWTTMPGRSNALGICTKAGQTYGPKVDPIANNAVIDKMWMVPVVMARDCTLDRLGTRWGDGVAASATMTVRLGIYADLDGLPTGAPLATVNIPANQAGFAYVDGVISLAVLGNTRYWIAAAQNGTGTPANICAGAYSGDHPPVYSTSSPTQRVWRTDSVTGALPTNPTRNFVEANMIFVLLRSA